MIREDFLHFIWRHELYYPRSLKTTCGKALEIFRPGIRNDDAGPDFFNARIRVDQLVWAGNIELHINATDWVRHGHHEDPAYNNVILHVVCNFDGEIRDCSGRRIYTTVLHFPEYLHRFYIAMVSREDGFPCDRFINRISPRHMQKWLSRLYADRLREKTVRISRLFLSRDLGQEEVLYRALGSGFGLPVNCLPFEMITSRIPLKLLLEQRDSLMDLEALLFGQSGLIPAGSADGPYARGLLERYLEMPISLKREPVPRHLWKFLRLRPASFPTLKISQFASLIQLRFPLAESLLVLSSVTELEQMLRVSASSYWDTHYRFGKGSTPSAKYLGPHSVRNLIINTIIPFLNAMELVGGRNHSYKLAADIQIEMKAESNHIVEKWIKFGVKPGNAMESQALIQLYNCYCRHGRCMDCQIGKAFIETSLHEK